MFITDPRSFRSSLVIQIRHKELKISETRFLTIIIMHHLTIFYSNVCYVFGLIRHKSVYDGIAEVA